MLILWEKQNGRNGMEAHGTSGVIPSLETNAFTSTFKPSTKKPECGTTDTPCLKVVGILFSNSM